MSIQKLYLLLSWSIRTSTHKCPWTMNLLPSKGCPIDLSMHKSICLIYIQYKIGKLARAEGQQNGRGPHELLLITISAAMGISFSMYLLGGVGKVNDLVCQQE